MLKEHNEMTIHLPPDIESSIQAAVHSGHFASVDAAMTEAASLLLQKLNLGKQQTTPSVNGGNPDPVLGCMRDDAELMDEIVADAYRHRREDNWRDIDL
jgi:Arc/MetJ-type ribon-helix-helix transcriptional regulator